MLKYIGAILLTAGATLWGFSGAKSLRDRGIALRAVETSLEIMCSEVCDRLTPVPELFAILAERGAKPADRLYANAQGRLDRIGALPFSEIWEQAVLATPELMLSNEERLTLCRLGHSLGRYDIGEQRRAITAAKERFGEYAAKAEAERDKNWKSQAFLGIAAGLFTVIILL